MLKMKIPCTVGAMIIVKVICCFAGEKRAVVRNDSTFEEIVVTGAKADVKVTNATAQVTVIDSIDLLTGGAATTEDFLSTIPGVAVVRNMGEPQLSINGLESEYTKRTLGTYVSEGPSFRWVPAPAAEVP